MTIQASQVMELRTATGAGMMDCKKALEEMEGDIEAAKDFLRKKGISIAQKKSSRKTNEGGIALSIAADGKSAAMVQLACETDFVARNEQFGALLDRLAAQALQSGTEDFANQTVAEGGGTVTETLTEAIGKLGENLRLLEAARLELKGEGRIGGYVHSNRKIGVLVALGSEKALTDAGDASPATALAKDLAMHIAASQVVSVSGSDIDPAVIEKEKEIYSAQAKESGKPEDIVEKMVQGRLKKFMKEITLLEQSFVKNPDTTVKALLEDMGKEMGTGLQVEQFVKFQF